MSQITRSAGIILLVCVGVRVAAAIVEPVLPAVVIVTVTLLILSRLFGGPRSRDF